ncbi:MAG: oligosaccharide flippase family protein [Clostridia bacterium]|nr:oligosaccharide flippase family protein [Clostridia bacterium]
MKKLIQKYKSMPVAAKCSIWFAFSGFFQKGISLVPTPLFTRLLTTEQYGQFSVFQSWYQIISIFATLNLAYGVFNNGMTKYPEDRNRYVSSMQGLSSVVTLLLLCLYLPFREYINELTGLSTLLMLTIFAECLAAPALAFWSARQRYQFRYIALVSVTIGITVISPVIGLFAVSLAEEKGIARILSAAVINVCVGFFFYVLNVARGKKLFNKEYWMFALKFNIPLIPHYLSTIVLAQSDRVMIERIVGESAVAIYSVAYTFSLVMNIVLSSINSSYVPWTYQNLKQGNVKVINKTTSLLILGFAIFSVLPILIAPEFMKIIAPPEYSAGVWVIPPVSASVFFMFLYHMFANIEFYFEKNKLIMVASVVTALINIILNALFIPVFGYVAAAYTTLVCYVFFAFAHYVLMCKISKTYLNTKCVYNEKLIFVISFAYIGCTALAMSLYNLVIVRYAILLVVFVAIVIKREKVFEIVKNIKKSD